ncbi:MAG: TonB-dependent receptor [Sandaracinus sp.]|nr:TonB-dependent receptor [Sandaracinus sp.]
MRRPSSFALACWISLLVAAPALAQDAPAAPVITPPRLVEFVEATFPPGAEAEGLEGRVLVAITIAADGAVTDVQVVRPAGNGFDEAAVDAVRRFRFEPARRDGAPVPVRIQYEYVFERRVPEPPPEPEVPDEPPPPAAGRLEGRVLGREDGAPIRNAEIYVSNAELGIRRRLVAGEDGRFSADELPPGSYTVVVLADEFGETTQTEEVVSGEITDVTYRLDILPEEEDGDDFGFGAEAVIDPPPREVTRRTIRREQLTTIPGTRGDALRAVELLPGVGRPPFGAGALIVRGAAPQDSQTFFEGVPVPLLYHFGGLTSVVNSRLLEQIDFYPGNFSARYGRKMGGILEVGFRDPLAMHQDRRFHGVAELSLIDASLLAEFPLGDNAAMAAAVRRSTIDGVFSALPEDTFTITALPVYYDYQGFITWTPTPRDKFRILAYGASDRFGLFAGDSLSDEDPNVRGNLDLLTRFHFLDLAWDHTFDERTVLDIDFEVGTSIFEFSLGDLVSFEARFNQIYGRAELRHRANDRVRLIAGLDMFITPLTLLYVGPRIGQQEGGTENQGLGEDNRARYPFDGVAYRPAIYFESDMRPFDWVQILLGLRLDYAKDIQQWAFDPRFAAIFTVADGYRLKVGAGIFSQPPEFQESAEGLGNPNLDMIHSAHFGLGTDAEVAPGIRLGLEGFYKRLWDRVVGTEGGVEPFFDNAGIGRIYGMEVSGRIDPRQGRNITGFLSYTLMRSERRDRPGQDWRLFDFDQTHIFTLSATYKLPRNWSVGGTLRLVSGNPSTPVTAGIYNPADGTANPIALATNSTRNPLFNRFDLRIEKQWQFESWKLALFLDIQNLWNADNPEGTIYNYNYTQSVPINGLPFIPALGIRGEL